MPSSLEGFQGNEEGELSVYSIYENRVQCSSLNDNQKGKGTRQIGVYQSPAFRELLLFRYPSLFCHSVIVIHFS